MREIGTKQISGKKIEVSDWSPSKALRWEKRLIPRISKAGGYMAGALVDDRQIGNNISTAVAALFDDLSEAQWEEWHKELVEGVIIDGRPVNFSDDFGGGKLRFLNEIVVFVIAHQFRDFFVGRGGDVVSRLEKKLAGLARLISVPSNGKSGA